MRSLFFVTTVLLYLCLPCFAAEPIATAMTNWDGIEIDLMTVVRKGNVVTVKWAVRNTRGDKNLRPEFLLTGKEASTFLMDEENGTKYFALTDEKKIPISSGSVYLGGGYGLNEAVAVSKTIRYWTKFPAPPPDVKSIAVIFSKSEPLEGVPITDK